MIGDYMGWLWSRGAIECLRVLLVLARRCALRCAGVNLWSKLKSREVIVFANHVMVC